MPYSPIEIRAIAGKGRGAFATRAIEAGEILERAMVLVMSARELGLINQTQLSDYLFYWPINEEVDEALVFGMVQAVNYAEDPNTNYVRHLEERILEWVSLRRIEAGEELTAKYRHAPWFIVQ